MGQCKKLYSTSFLHCPIDLKQVYLIEHGVYMPTKYIDIYNAKNWYYRAQRAGYRTGHKPKRYAIMQSTAGYYGH
jgi:hypothetical protein